MKKAYILVYSTGAGSRESIRQWADESELVITWRYDLPFSFYLISTESADQLTRDLLKYTNKRGRFIISEVQSNHSGWLPQDAWHLLREKEHAPKKR